MGLGGPLLGTQGVKSVAGAEARVGGATSHQLLDVFAGDLGAFALSVGPMRATDVRALVPLEAEPPQGLENPLFAGDGAALTVGVLDPQDELAAVLPSQGQVEERYIGGADVGITGRAGRDAGSHGL